jgi:hypothetical protein
MKGLPSGPVTLPLIVAANALDARQTVNVRETRTLSAKCLLVKGISTPVSPRFLGKPAGEKSFAPASPGKL